MQHVRPAPRRGSIWEYFLWLIDIIGLFVAMYVSELLVQNMVFGGAVYLLGDVWVSYARLYGKRGISLLPPATRGMGVVIFIVAGVLTVALVFFYPYLQSKTTALALVVLILGFNLQEIVTESIARRMAAGRRRTALLALAHTLFLAAYGVFFALNQFVVQYAIPGEIRWVYVAVWAMGFLLWIAQVMNVPDPGAEEPEPIDAARLMDVHAYRVYNNMAVNTFFAINLSITAFTCYMYFVPGRGFGPSMLLLLTWMTFIAVVTLLCMWILSRRFMPRYDRPGIFLAGLVFWVLAAVRVLHYGVASFGDSVLGAALMGLSLGCMLSIILEQSMEMKTVVELGVGHIDGGAYARNTEAMLEWARLMSMLLLLVMLTVTSFLMDGTLDRIEAKLGLQRVMQVIVMVLPLVFVLIGMVFSLLQPLDRQYAEKLRKFRQQAQAGEENPPLERRLKKILVSNYPRRLAVTVLKPIIRPFMPCRVRGVEHVDVANGPVVFVVNHLELYGPVMAVLHSPFYFRPWVIHDMLDRDIIEAHMRTGMDNLPRIIPKRLRGPLLHRVSPLVVWLMQSTDPIPVYRGTVRGVIQTIQASVEAMEYDDNILLFPEINYQQEGVGDFFTGFVQVAKTYWRQTGRLTTFYPVYINRRQRTMTYGPGITYDPERGAGEEKERIVEYLQGRMNGMAAE